MLSNRKAESRHGNLFGLTSSLLPFTADYPEARSTVDFR